MLQWGRDLSVAEGLRRRAGAEKREASMGPRPFGRGRGTIRRPGGGRSGGGFNGAATFRSRKASYTTRGRSTSPLQWGRDLSVAEGRGGGPPIPPCRKASMGPRPFGRGRVGIAGGVLFQLVASMGPRPFGRGRAQPPGIPRLFLKRLQWGRDLSVAEGSRFLRIGSGYHCFNGAATFRSRKEDAEKGARD